MSDPLTVYISGRVTGLPREGVEAKFNTAGALLHANGQNPINPLKAVPGGRTQREAMQKLLPLLLDCDAILMLEDWEHSAGAKIEFQLAQYVGMKIYFEEDFN
jgi:hypothetical protein